MKKIIAILRDPIWQSIGVLVTVLVFFFSTSESRINEVSIIPSDDFANLSEYFPDSKIKFTIQGETANLDNLYYRYFSIYNPSASSFKANDFEKNISVKPINRNVEIVLISQCTGKRLPKDIVNATEPELNWVKAGEVWELSKNLLNSGESGCSIMIVRNLSPSQEKIKDKDFVWDGRIVGSKIKWYPNWDTYLNLNLKPFDYLLSPISIYFEGTAIIWFLILQFLLFSVPTLIVRNIQIQSLLKTRGLYILALLSITTSEILVSTFIDKERQHPIIWPLLATHLLLFIYITSKAIRQR